MRIPMKWGTDSDEVGQHQSEATLVMAMITEVPHFSQVFLLGEGKGAIGIISFPSSRFSPDERSENEVGRDSDGSGAAFRNWWGTVPNEAGQPRRVTPEAASECFWQGRVYRTSRRSRPGIRHL